MKKRSIFAVPFLVIFFIISCQKNNITPDPEHIVSDPALSPDRIAPMSFFVPENFVEGVDNPYFSFVIGDTLMFHLTGTEDGEAFDEDVFVTETGDIEVIMGINCIVVHDYVLSDGVLSEDTYDWYAQDIFGNVWYFGEDTKTYNDDGTFSTEGSFRNGTDGAVAGFIMLADPSAHIAQTYRQEYYPDQAMDRAMVLSANETVTIGYGTFYNCVKTEEVTKLEPGVKEFKYYAPGIGEILSEVTIGGDEHQELIGVE